MNSWDAAVDNAVGWCTKTFGQTVSYIPAGDAQIDDLPAIFEASHTVVEAGEGIDFETVKPVLFLRWSDVLERGMPDPRQDDRVVIDGGEYSVESVQTDGHAEVTLILMEVANA
jgi:hypothetical protein